MLPGMRSASTPFERLWDVRRDLDRLFEGGEPNGNTLWAPPMDVVERENEILCYVELPGMSRDALDIRVEGNLVTIAGEKKYEQNRTEKEGFRHVERRYGRFERSFTIPATVEQDNVTARYDNGVLTVTLPKAERSRPRRIAIEGSETREIESK
jgi:HSP20 family protein